MSSGQITLGMLISTLKEVNSWQRGESAVSTRKVKRDLQLSHRVIP